MTCVEMSRKLFLVAYFLIILHMVTHGSKGNFQLILCCYKSEPRKQNTTDYSRPARISKTDFLRPLAFWLLSLSKTMSPLI